jgi:hypothetical protein
MLTAFSTSRSQYLPPLHQIYSWGKDSETIGINTANNTNASALEIPPPRPYPTLCRDPYREPGYLYIPPDKHYSESFWLPFTPSLYSAAAPSSASYPPPDNRPVYFQPSAPEPTFRPPPSLLSSIISDSGRYPDTPADPSFSWLQDRRILLIGDSVDRFMTQFFCEEFSTAMEEEERHTTATCHVSAFNLTLVHWHFPGTYTTRPDWWWMPSMDTVAFEERWERIWAPTIPSNFGTRSPDLILFQNGLWDQRALWEAGAADDTTLPSPERQMVWEEVRFVMARMKKMVSLVKREFGEDAPLMYRAVTTHRDSDVKDASLYEIERIGRFVAQMEGLEVFEWGRIMTAMGMLYMDKTHLAKGPASWLWAEMLMTYTKRSVVDGWGKCHVDYLRYGWGGR